MGLKPLGVVKEIVEAVGIGISYAYDDLVFVDHNAFIIQFTDNASELLLHVNIEADEEKVMDSISILNAAAADRGMKIVAGKYYSLVQADEENVRLEFQETRE